MNEDELLDTLLSAACDEIELPTPSTKCLKDVDLFSKEKDSEPTPSTSKTKNGSSFIHSGDTDSSDDEDNKYQEERKYNDYGRDIKHLLETKQSTSLVNSTPRANSFSKPVEKLLQAKPVKPTNLDVYMDPIFGIRIINPLVSSTTLRERMEGRQAVPFAALKKFLTGNLTDKNWVIAGVIVGRSAVKTSQKGSQYLIWSLSDLKDDIKTVSMFLFSSAYKQLWKTATGTVVGILNPSVLDKRDGSKDEACLSVDSAQKVMVLGKSKDLGICKSIRKSGDQCTSIVNLSRCEYCIYHIKQEYQKCSRRSELQSSFAGKGLTALRNKVLGKNEVFYAGKSYTAIPARRNAKLQNRNEALLKSLSGRDSILAVKKKVTKRKAAPQLEISQNQRLKDIDLLSKLGGGSSEFRTDFNASHSSDVTFESSKSTVLNVLSKLKSSSQTNDDVSISPLQNVNGVMNGIPGCSNPVGFNSLVPNGNSNDRGNIDLNFSITRTQMNRAKMNAMKYIKQKGPLKKSDPNNTKSTGGKKRGLENDENQKDPKVAKIERNEFFSERFKKMMGVTSKHMDLLDERDDEEQAKYFKKLEMKEQMEEKMTNTYKVPCKAVRCLTCKYTNFSASQKCKDEKHPLRVFDSMKRFFKCGNCGNRTVCLEIVPTTACKNCGSGKWERTGMMKEKTAVASHTLSIRGGEQEFINSVSANDNINLLVPDD